MGGLPAGIIPYAWYDADAQTESDNTEIVTLVDQSGNARDFARFTAQGPLLKHAVLNSKKVIQTYENTSGGTLGTRMTIANTFLESVSAASFFMVKTTHQDPPETGDYDGAPLGQIENHGGATHMPYGDGNVYTGFCSTTRRSFNPTPSLTAWHIWAEHSASNDWAAWMNGATVYTDATNTVDSGTDTRVFGGGGASNWWGQVAEFLFFDSVLPTSDRQKVEGYLAHKWGLTSVLDAAHPYKTTPPT